MAGKASVILITLCSLHVCMCVCVKTGPPHSYRCVLLKAKAGYVEEFQDALSMLHGKDADISEEAEEIQVNFFDSDRSFMF